MPRLAFSCVAVPSRIVMSSARPVTAVCAQRASSGLKDVVASGFKAAIIDQFGVLHDGATPYPTAAAALTSLVSAGVKIIILSNSSRRSSHAQLKLTAMFPLSPDLHVITSGELARTLLRSSAPPVPTANVLHTNWSGRGSIDAADNALSPTLPSAAAATSTSFSAIVAHGTEGITLSDGTVEALPFPDLRDIVAAAASPDTPMLCVNPDIVTVDGGVGLRPMPGALASAFEEAGGNVLRVGKPGALAYEAALAAFAEAGVSKDEVVCIGDSVAHDIAGAHGQGLASLFIAGGIDAQRFGLDSRAGEAPTGEWEMEWQAWEALVRSDAPGLQRPSFVLDYFKW